MDIQQLKMGTRLCDVGSADSNKLVMRTDHADSVGIWREMRYWDYGPRKGPLGFKCSGR